MAEVDPMDLKDRTCRLRLAGSLMWVLALSGCGWLQTSSTPPCTSMESTDGPPSAEAAVVKALQRQLRERDRRIQKLQSHLEALKLIDQDRHNQRRDIHPSTTITPFK